jgi:hypothetical protein
LEALFLPSDEEMIREALKTVEAAQKAGLILRIIGAGAVRIHCSNNLTLHKALGRTLSDIDYIAYSKQRDKIEKFFVDELKYELVKAAITPGLFMERSIFIDKTGNRPHVDVFYDRLRMNHIIEFKDRLEKDYPTIPLEELMLEKLQIVKINEKDIKDLIVLILEHEIGENGKEIVDGTHIARILARDWGFYYTVTTNLNKVESFLQKYEVLTQENREIASTRIKKLLKYIEDEPKPLKWKLRAKIGPTTKWYEEVEEVERVELPKELK